MITPRQRFLSYARGDGASWPWVWLIPFGGLVRLWVTFRGWLYDRGILRTEDGGAAVVAVGNVTFGGTGKTPCVIHLLDALSRPGRTLGVASRGYRGLESTFRGSPPAGAGDEARLVARHHPEVWIASAGRRARAVQRLAREGVDVVVADDAFQHRQLRRCFDLVLLDARRPFGNGRVLPAGMLRETPRALRRADAILITRTDEATADELACTRDALSSILGKERARERVFSARSEIVRWQVRSAGATDVAPAPPPEGRVLAFCGIGAPESFRATLGRAGVEVVDLVAFPDHHRYREADLEGLEKRAVREHASLICTEKDLMNLPDRPLPIPIRLPELRLRVADGERLVARIEEKLTEHESARRGGSRPAAGGRGRG